MSRKATDGFFPLFQGNALVGAVFCRTKLLMHLGIVLISQTCQKFHIPKR